MKTSFVASISILLQGTSNAVRWGLQCPMIKCLDPCSACPLGSESCITEPTVFYHYYLKCSGCPKLVSCVPPPAPTPCCDSKLKPSDVECGRSGCTCCGGLWIPGNSGPTLPPKDVCQRLELPATDVCSVVNVYEDVPITGERCGNIVCSIGQECCNASCNVCANPGDLCTQQVCFDELNHD
jgi:hypothetical protein